MAGRFLTLTFRSENYLNTSIPLFFSYRHGHRLRGKPPGVAKTLQQRLEVGNAEDMEISKKINIGFPQLRVSRSQQLKERLDVLRKQHQDSDLEKLSRTNQLKINLKEANKNWIETSGPFHIRDITNHYEIYEHLFGTAYFIPRIPLSITYKSTDGTESNVYHGNRVSPSQASSEPKVTFNSNIDFCGFKTSNKSLWTLILTNPDGQIQNENKEYVHWFKANITDGDLTNGDEIVPYLQPIPARGIGFQRHIFILYKQEKYLDFKDYAVNDGHNLNERLFTTLEFYRKYQDDITPAGLAFFQSEWDPNLSEFYKNVLKIKEPIYEYDFPKPYVREQEWFPLRQPFNTYLDKYRSEKEIAKEYVLRKLSETHPSNGPETRLRFPNAHSIKGIPSWLKTEKVKSRLGKGRINDYKY